jgi:hypothetical protein
MRVSSITTVLLLVIAARAAAQDTTTRTSRQPVRPGNAIPAPEGTPCVFDFERGEIPNCVVASANGELIVASHVLKELRFDGHGLAAVLSPREGWMYVNRRGRVVITGVPVYDNWADSFHDELVRIVRDGKYGFANRSGQVVISPVYDGAMNFEKGRATVCKGCQDKCADRDCEHHFFAGGEWFRIDTKGTVLARVHPDN